MISYSLTIKRVAVRENRLRIGDRGAAQEARVDDEPSGGRTCRRLLVSGAHMSRPERTGRPHRVGTLFGVNPGVGERIAAAVAGHLRPGLDP